MTSDALLQRLPVAALEGELRRALGEGPVVLTAPTGSGKSTCVPLWAAELGRGGGGAARGPRVVVVEPRRVACRSLARFLAGRLEVRLGERVGYAVRHDGRLGDRTEVAYVTPGVALRLLREGRIDAETVVVLDEFHERGLELDLLLAVLLARGHQRLVVLSATIDVERIARHVTGARLEAAGRLHPVEVRHVGQRLLPDGRELPERVAAALSQLSEGEGDVLVFLPGKAEIAACARQLARGPLEPLPLHGGLPAAEQDRAFAAASGRRAILATNVAETSVTLPYVRAVVDSGLVRRTVYREGRGALSISAIARDSAEQRTGRAGRVGPGRCLRLWHRDGRLEQRTPPEILREDLSSLVLWSLHLGHEPEVLPWLDPPRDYALAEGRRVLERLGILDRGGGLSDVGRRVARLPADPVLSRLLEAGREQGVVGDVIQLVAALSLDRPLFAPGEPAVPETIFDADPLTDARCDATALIVAVRQGERHRRRLRPGALAEARRTVEQLQRLLGVERLPGADVPVDREGVARAVLGALEGSAYARRARRGRQQAWGNGRQEVQLGRESLIADEVKTVLVVDQRLLVERGRRLRRIATCCMPVTPDLLRRAGAGEQVLVGVKARRRRVLEVELEQRIGAVVLARRREVPEGELARRALVEALSSGALMRDEIAAARAELEAYNLVHPREPLVFEDWLAGRVEAIGFGSGEDLALLTAADFEPGLLDPAERAAIDERFPRQLAIAGSRLRVSYEVEGRRITLRGKVRPKADLLPRWPGWTVRFDDGKHTVTLRSR